MYIYHYKWKYVRSKSEKKENSWMKTKILKIISIFGLSLFLCAYQIHGQDDSIHGTKKKPTVPVFKYEPEPEVSSSCESLYEEYHLVGITALYDAAENLNSNQPWSKRMLDNAYRYLGLLDNLLIDAHKGVFDELSQDVKQIRDNLDQNGRYAINIKKTISKIKEIAEQLKNKYEFSQIKEWVKNDT